MGYFFWLAARVILYEPSHRHDSTYHSLCSTSCGALAGTRNNSMGPPWRINPMTHHTISKCSYHWATSRSPSCWTHWTISFSSQCSTTCVTKAVVCAIKKLLNCCIYLLPCLYPLKVQACSPGHTPKLLVYDSELVSLLAHHRRGIQDWPNIR